MKPASAIVIAFGVLASSVHAEGALSFGIGASSCATVLSQRQREAEAQIWIMGAWSALNITNSKKRTVGRYSDGAAVMQAIKATCQRDPGLQLAAAVVYVYKDFERLGR